MFSYLVELILFPSLLFSLLSSSLLSPLFSSVLLSSLLFSFLLFSSVSSLSSLFFSSPSGGGEFTYWGLLGRPWGLFGRSWGFLGRSAGHLGAVLGGPGAALERSRRSWGVWATLCVDFRAVLGRKQASEIAACRGDSRTTVDRFLDGFWTDLGGPGWFDLVASWRTARPQ